MRLLHGGDLGQARAAFGEPEGGWIDLSTGVNPWPWPAPPLSPDALTRLPSEEGLADLAAAAARAFGARRALPVPGAQAAIQHLPHLLPPGDVAVVSPTYGEHAPAWEAAGHRVRRVAEPMPAGVLVVANPNNPDGRSWRPDELLDLDCGLLVVDESFVDAVPELSLAGHGQVVVLRSFGKFYGLPGLRLGFALGPDGCWTSLRSGSALARLRPALANRPAALLATRPWAAEARARLERAAAGSAICWSRAASRWWRHPLFPLRRGEGGAARSAAMASGSAPSRTCRAASASACRRTRPPGRGLRACKPPGKLRREGHRVRDFLDAA